MKTKYTIQFFKDYAANKNGACLSNEYINGETKLLWECEESHQWEAQPKKILEGSWCPECAIENNRKYHVNHDFFATDTEESFYIAGFLAADGWKTRTSDSYHIGLKLCKEDLNHLIKIKNYLSNDAILKYSEGKSPGSDNVTYAYKLGLNSKKMFDDLIRFNVVERKTYIYQMPEWLISHPLVHHFMRGYADGDGCFGLAQNKGQSPHVLFCMRGTMELLTQYNQILTDAGVVKEKHSITQKRGAKRAAFDTLRYSGNTVCSRLYDFLYKDATLYLERKKEIAEKAKDLAIESTGKMRKRPESKYNITKEALLEKAAELKSQKKIAEYFQCTPSNISFMINSYNIREEMNKALGKFTKEDIHNMYKTLGTATAVGKYFGITASRVSQILKEI